MRIINVFLSLCCQSPFPCGSHSPPDLPRMPSDTVLSSGPAVGAAQTIIWSCSWVFLPPLSTAVRASAFSLVGALSGLLHAPQTQSLLSWSCGFNLQLYSWWEAFGSSSLATLPLVSIVVLFPPLHVGRPLRFSSWGRPEGLGLPLWGPGAEVVQLLGSQGFWQHQVLGGSAAKAAGNTVL